MPRSIGCTYVAEFVSQKPFLYLLPVKMTIFGSLWPKMFWKWCCGDSVLFLSLDPSLRRPRPIRCTYFVEFRETGTILIPPSHDNGHFLAKNGLKLSENDCYGSSVLFNPNEPPLRSTQVNWMHLCCWIFEPGAILIAPTAENGHFWDQNGQKMVWNGLNPHFFSWFL